MLLTTLILKFFGNLNLCHSNLFRISILEFRVSPSLISGLNVTMLTTFHFANLEYRIYETGH